MYMTIVKDVGLGVRWHDLVMGRPATSYDTMCSAGANIHCGPERGTGCINTARFHDISFLCSRIKAKMYSAAWWQQENSVIR